MEIGMIESVVLVDTSGNAIGTCEKLEAHQEGLLHLAFSLVVLRKTTSGVEHLLQRRALNKYHSGGQWSNACCSHPRPGEPLERAVRRRAEEELGLRSALSLDKLSTVTYRSELENGLVEHEYDHIFVSECEDDSLLLQPNPQEVVATQWMSEDLISQLLTKQPEYFTAWFPLIFSQVLQHRGLVSV